MFPALLAFLALLGSCAARDLPSTCAINDDPLQLLEECPKSKPVKLALWRDHGNEALGRVECASVCVPCAAAQSQARASMRFHTQQACEDAHTAQFEQTVVVYGACNQGVGEDIATAMAGALNSGVVPHILEATVEFKDCVVEGAAAAASFGAAKAKAPHKKAPGRATHKPVSAGGVRGVARPRGRQLSVVQQPVAPPPNAHYTMTITYTSALVSNVAGVESAIVQGSTARAGGFCDLYGVCDDLLANSGVVVLGDADAPRTVIIERGLPTDNLNNGAGALRSNVAWAFDSPDVAYFVPDTFTLPATATSWTVDKLTMWVVAGDANTAVTWADRFDALPVLRMGTTLETMADMASATVTVGKAAYAGGVDYQGYSGAFRQLWRIVFENVGFVRSTGGPVFFSAYATPKAAQKYFSAHASNAALSGSQQTGADGELYYFAADGSDSGSWASGDPGWGWDKDSDINVLATAVEAPPAA